ncbi:MAG: hypothetical protein QM762_18080 [Chryseolinea sp.]
MMNNLIANFKRINSSIWTEWILRIAITLEFIQTVSVMPDDHYPDAAYLLILIALWCYFLRLRILGFVPLVFALLIHYWHGH